jgi:hypothetical protein
MKKRILFASSFCVASLFAHDVDTLAFYAFKEGDSGSSLSGNVIVNDAGGEFSGAVSINSGTVQYSSDAPGDYVFSSEAHGAAICERPQSVCFSGNSTAGSQYVSFPGLGTAVSLNDDFTVEFFFKYAAGDGGANKTIPVLSMNCGLIYNPSDASIDGAGKPGLFGIMIHGNPDRYFDAYIVDRNHHKARSDANPSGTNSAYPTVGFADGLWHHVAVVYVKSTKKYTVYIDYGAKLTAAVQRDTDKTVLENQEAMLLGNGGFRGLLSCLRISKCARSADAFLRCSSVPTYSPETVFHWSFDGVNGETAQTLSSPYSVDPRDGQFIRNYSPRGGGGGEAWAYIDGNGVSIAPVYTNDIPERGHYAVMSGGGRICTSTNCLAVSAYGTDGNALCGDGRKLFPVSGSWTMEGWFNMDYPRYKANVVDVDDFNPHAELLGLGYSYGDNVNGMDFSLYLHHTSGEFKLKLNAYDSNQKSYDAAGISLGSTFRDDAWHHVAVVYDASTFTMTAYIDGAALSSITMNAPFAPRLSQDGRRYLVGHGSGRREFFGMIDEVRLVQRALSPAEFISFEKVKYGLRLTIK